MKMTKRIKKITETKMRALIRGFWESKNIGQMFLYSVEKTPENVTVRLSLDPIWSTPPGTTASVVLDSAGNTLAPSSNCQLHELGSMLSKYIVKERKKAA
jgi:hypothetical protein